MTKPDAEKGLVQIYRTNLGAVSALGESGIFKHYKEGFPDLVVSAEHFDALLDEVAALRKLNQKLTDEAEQQHQIIAALKARIAELEKQSEWMPVSERLPELGPPVLVTTAQGVSCGQCWGVGNWSAASHSFWNVEPLAWRPLPAAYQADKKEGGK